MFQGYPLFALTVLVTSFAGVFVWAYWPRRQPSFEQQRSD
jgi:hypothetical protein